VFAHGGQLRIESEPGRGTTVHVTLPIGVSGEAPPDAAPRPLASS
jgi:signal transduction histidine kinase